MHDTWNSALRRSSVLAAVALLLTSSGCSSSDDPPPPPTGERVVYAEGRTVHLGKASGGSLVHVAQASIPAGALLDGHTIFGILKHPTKPWLYVTSFNECRQGSDWCWGNARIDRFTVSASSIAHAGVAFTYDASATLATCAADDWGYTGQVGACAPVDGVFSPDASRLYIQDDDNDVLHIFSVAANGSLTMLSEGGDLDLHGLAMDPTGVSTYLYNGSHVLAVADDVGTNVSWDTGGNYATWLSGNQLLSTTYTNGVAVYSLADPASPSVVDSLTIGSNMSRAVVINSEKSRLVAVGRNSVATVGFDGASLTVEDSFDPSGGGTTVENRSVALVGGGSHAAVSWFQVSDTTPSGYVGGVSVYGIDPDGLLTTTGTVNLGAASRVVKSFVF